MSEWKQRPEPIRWLNGVPEAMSKDVMHYCLSKLRFKTRDELESGVDILGKWLDWFDRTHFDGRVVTNQFLFAVKAKIIMERILIRMGQRQY